MSGGSSPKKRTTTSGISVNKQSNVDDYNVTGTVTLSRKSMGMATKASMDPPPQKTAPPPPSEIAKMPYSVATAKDVLCPKCQDKYDITKEYYNTVTQCLGCKAYFVIRPPGTPPYKPATPSPVRRPGARPPAARQSSTPPKQRSTTSGIQVEGGGQNMGVTGTVLLSRSGMSMMQRRRGEKRASRQNPPPPPPAAAVAGMIYSVATARDVGCPKCNERFEISPEFHNAVAECPDCGCEFVIKPPGTAPYQPSASPARPGAAPRTPAPPASPPQQPARGPVASPPARTTTTHPVPRPAQTTSQPAPAAQASTTPQPAAPPPPAETKKALDPLVLGLFVTIVLLLVAIIVILLIIK